MTLDAAAALMAQGGDGAGHAFYHALAGADLVLLLAQDVTGDDLAPRVFDLAAGPLVLAFDSEDRLAAWAQDMGLGPQPYAALPGRVIAQFLAQNGTLGLGLNFGAGTASELVLPPQAMGWLVQMLDVAPLADMGQIAQVLPLGLVPADVMASLQRGLGGAGGGAGGMARRAVLARVQYRSAAAAAHVLAIFGASARDHAPLARAVAEALAFAGQDGAALDVIFPSEDHAIAKALCALGADIPLPAAPPAPEHGPTAPGMDPARPPKLR